MILEKWNRFWFESDFSQPVRIFRMALAALLFLFFLIRSPDLGFFYSRSGIAPTGDFSDSISMVFRFSIFNFFGSDTALWIANIVLLVSLLSLAFGFFPRLSALVAFVIHVSFVHRDMAAAYGVDLISCFLLLYLALIPAGKPRSYYSQMIGSMAFRLAQIQICIIYAYSGLEKLKGPLWWRGEALWSVLGNPQLARWDFQWLASWPLAISVATYMTVLWEIYFPVLVWPRRSRYWVLGFGILMHLGIAVAMNLPFFGILMIVALSLFLFPKDAQKLGSAVQNLGFLAKVWRRAAEKNYV